MHRGRSVFLIGMGAGVVLMAAGCGRPSGGAASPGATLAALPSHGPGATAPEPGLGASVPLGPDPKITPGATLPVTKDDVCVSGYSQKVRNVPESVKRQAYALYGIATHKSGEYEVDHLISLELGGSNSIKNLWPESYQTRPWNAHVKDQLENALHADVCSGRMDLKAAQQKIAGDWIASYKQEFHTDAPLKSTKRGHRKGRPAADAAAEDAAGDTAPAPAGDTAPAPAGDTAPAPAGDTAPAPAVASASAPGQVWVNLGSGKYFLPGAKYYGKTKQGKYLSEADAKKQGYVAAQ